MQADWGWLYNTTTGVIIAFAGLVGAFVAIIKGGSWLYSWGLNKLKAMIGLRGLIEKQNVIEQKIDKVLGELTHNGGHSTKDVIKSVSETVMRVESRQQAMFDSFTNDYIVFECTVFGDLLWASKSFCYLTERTKEELMGKGWLNAVTPSYRGRVINEFDGAIDQNREFELDFEMFRRDGEKFMVNMKTTKMTDHKGRLLGYFGSIHKTEDGE